MLLTPRGLRAVVDDLHIEQALDALFQRGRRLLCVGIADRGEVAGFLAHLLHDAQHMKIRAITLGYNFDNLKPIKNIGISRLRLYATVQNPFVLFSPYNIRNRICEVVASLSIVECAQSPV